jgi:transposase
MKPTPPPMAEQLVPDQIWDAIAPLLPAHPPQPKGGRPWISDRAVLGGLISVLRSSTAWRLLPAKALGCGSRVTCWRRLRSWQQAGVWEQLHHRLLDWLGDDGRIDWSRASLDSVAVRAKHGGADRSSSGRSRQARIQGSPAGRRPWDPLGGRPFGGQHPRLGGAGAAGGRGPGDHRAAGPARPASPAPGPTACRYGL